MSVQTELIPTHSLELGKIHCGDCIELMQRIDSGTIGMVFADPPFNIGYEYDQYDDRQDRDEYISWSTKWMDEVHRALRADGTFWLAIGDEYAAELKVEAQRIGFTTRSWVVWYYTFGVNCTKKFSRSHVHLFHFIKEEDNFTFNSEAIRVPSARALVYADKRANPAGRLPDDTWVLRPQDLPEGFQPLDDTWYYSRVAGTFSERQGFHGCQMPEQLLGRIVRVSSNPGDVVLDPFAGSGTTLAVAKKLDRKWIGCEVSKKYVEAATERLDAVHEGDALVGPVDPIASAPTTANGRRLESATKSDDAATSSATAPSSETRAIKARDFRELVRDVIVEAFYATHDGYSTDWLLCNPKRQTAFHDACHEIGLIGSPCDWNRELLRLRKSGTFPKRGKTKKVIVPSEDMDAYSFAAEIAWRLTSDKFAGSSLDDIYCDPEKAQYFDRTAGRFAPGYAPEDYRWAALHLRKASKELVADMKRYHFIFRTREFRRPVRWDRCEFDHYVGSPGVYSLLSEDKNHLFVDQTHDLGTRLIQHSSCNRLRNCAQYLSIIAPDDLPGIQYQGGLKVDLIRRHEPSFNLTLTGLLETVAI